MNECEPILGQPPRHGGELGSLERAYDPRVGWPSTFSRLKRIALVRLSS